LDYLRRWDKVSIKTLKKEFQERYSDQNYNKIWENVEKIRRNKGKIFSYADYFQSEVQEFWMIGKR